MLSRLLGLVREQLFAALVGGGYFADAFVVAFRIPNLLRDLFAEGALSAAFVPVFARAEREEGKRSADELAKRVVGALLCVVGVLTLLGALFATPLVLLLAPGFAEEPGKVELTAHLARLMMPFLLFVSFAAVLMGMLNARGRFGTPALAPALFNVAAIVVGALLWLFGAGPRVAVIGWSIGTLLGGLVQFGIQLVPLSAAGFRFVPRLRGLTRDPRLRKMALLMAPAVLGLAATQLNIFINTQFASSQEGANAWLNYAFRLMYLPIGVFGVAVATVTATSLAHRAAERDLDGLRQGLSTGMKHVALLTIPSTVGLIMLAHPIIELIFERGRFTSKDTAATALALVGYSVGLYAYSGVKVAAPAFYALGRSKLPLIGSAAAVATNLAINLALFERVGYVGLAAGTSAGALVNLAILTVAFRRVTRASNRRTDTLRQLGQVTLASAVMGVALYFFDARFTALLVERFEVRSAFALCGLRVFCGIAVGVALYAAACKALRVREMSELATLLRRRARR